ncbi:MAG: hypothetical protein LBD76_00955 [Prevotellaceae bacterium]|jgi:hypothetical protein|nr:hypothetical protein [Prevotellaceae bacterium]
MAYNKDSGESKLRKNVNPDAYVRKTNKNIFKNSQTSTQPPPEQERKTNSNWEIPDVDVDNNVSNIEEFNLNPPRYGHERPRYGYEEREKKEPGETKQELLSFIDIIAIIAANGLFPVAGGFIYYIILGLKGEKQKAMQSIVLSAIVSIIRIAYIVNS